MSYILEALKKSELERQQGRVPDLTSAPIVIGHASVDGAASRRPLFFAAIVLLAVAGALIWWRPWQQGGQAVTAAVPAAPARPQVATPARVSPDLHIDLPVTSPHAASPPVATATQQQDLDHDPKAVAPSSRDVTMQPARSTTADSTRRETLKPPPEAQQWTESIPAPAPAVVHKAPATPVTEATVSTPPAASPRVLPNSKTTAQPPPAPAAKAESGKSAGKGMANLANLPAEVRKSVARIDVAGFSYSDDPQARMAVINDRILHEGDEVVPGVRLVKIGSDGIVFSHKGIRFRP
jgi:general secretion pathway protein B